MPGRQRGQVESASGQVRIVAWRRSGDRDFGGDRLFLAAPAVKGEGDPRFFPGHRQAFP